jgi:transposase
MSENILYVGMDTDKNHVDVAVAEPLPGGEVRYWGKVANAPAALDRVIKRLRRDGRQLQICYEAGPCGYGIYRRLNGKPNVSCQVVAPSLTPRRPGVRVKTNRRDCLTLAKLLRAEELTAIWVPDAAHEAMRDLIRARGAAAQDLARSRQRIGSFLLRQEIRYVGKPWTKKHRAWLGRLEFAAPAHRLLFGELLEALDQAVARRDRLNDHIAELVPSWSLAWLVEALQALRGYRLINAVSLVAEIGDPRRFANPRQLMGHIGIVPSEHSSGDKVLRGPLTKTGNRRARKVLIEAAWTYARAAKRPAARALAQPPAVRAIAEKARHRLGSRYRQLTARGKLRVVAIAAVARESLGFIWAIAQAAGPATIIQPCRPANGTGRGSGSR